MPTTPDARSDRRGSPSVFFPIVICFVAVVLIIALVIWNYESNQSHAGDHSEDEVHSEEVEANGEEGAGDATEAVAEEEQPADG